jgi:hypothetical protein
LGYQAGFNATGSYNIEIGTVGVSTDANTIRIGNPGVYSVSNQTVQTATYIAGIYNATGLTGLSVSVTPEGQLFAVASSERYKTDIAPMGADTAKLRQLRPVTFHYKTDTQRTLHYGLIAEEVAQVYPELVVRDHNGRIDGVRYDELASMLLNEVQKQQATIATQSAKIVSLGQQAAKINSLEQQLAEMHAVLAEIQAKDRLVAQR